MQARRLQSSILGSTMVGTKEVAKTREGWRGIVLLNDAEFNHAESYRKNLECGEVRSESDDSPLTNDS